jgi:hypothetical protein
MGSAEPPRPGQADTETVLLADDVLQTRITQAHEGTGLVRRHGRRDDPPYDPDTVPSQDEINRADERHRATSSRRVRSSEDRIVV